jgi:hypothetical protein
LSEDFLESSEESMQTRRLTWPELFSDRPSLDYARIFGEWAPWIVVDYEIAPVGMSALGSLFFAKRDGSIQCLDPIRGEMRQVASDFGQFQANMNSEAWQIENLHSAFVAKIVATGLQREPAQCYALAPHPNFTGGLSLDRSNVVVVDAVVWHSVCAQSIFTDGVSEGTP